MKKQEPAITIDFLNVGFGQAIVAYPSREKHPVLVIDGGDDRPEIYHSHKYALCLADYLRKINVSEIDLMIATHPHRDHIGGLCTVAKNFTVKRFVSFFDMPDNTLVDSNGNMGAAVQLYSQLIAQLKADGRQVTCLSQGADIKCGDIKIKIYPPNSSQLDEVRELLKQCCKNPKPEKLDQLSSKLNSVCMTLRLEINGAGVFLPNDAPLSVWDEFTSKQLRSEIMCVPHHGDAQCISVELLAKVKAKFAIFCADAIGTYGFPQPECITKLTQAGVEQLLFSAGSLYTETAGGACFEIDSAGSIEWRYI